MTTKKLEASQWQDMDESSAEETTYRITFTCLSDEYQQVEEEIRGYSEILKRERRI